MLGNSPFDGDGHEGENAAADGEDADEVGELAVGVAVGPVIEQHVGEVEDDVESGHHRIGDGKVHQEIVGDGAHPAVGQHDPDDHQIAHRGNDDDARVEDHPQQLAPQRQAEQVGAVRQVGLRVDVLVLGSQRLVPASLSARFVP